MIKYSNSSYVLGIIGSVRISDFSFTNSFATSSLLRCDKIRRIVQPVSSICIRLANDNQHAQDPYCKKKLSRDSLVFSFLLKLERNLPDQQYPSTVTQQRQLVYRL